MWSVEEEEAEELLRTVASVLTGVAHTWLKGLVALVTWVEGHWKTRAAGKAVERRGRENIVEHGEC